METASGPVGARLQVDRVGAHPQWGVPHASGAVQFEALGARNYGDVA
jgi:hypothetical protein